MYHILFYKTVDNYIEKRAIYRDSHLSLVKEAFKKGSLIMAGAYDQPANGAVLIFKGKDPKIAESFAINDPYVKNGLVTEWFIRKWNVVIEPTTKYDTKDKIQKTKKDYWDWILK